MKQHLCGEVHLRFAREVFAPFATTLHLDVRVRIFVGPTNSATPHTVLRDT